MKNADSQVAPRSTNKSFAVVQSHRTMLERHHEGNALVIQVERNIDFIHCEKGPLNVPEIKYNAQSKIVFAAIRELMTAPQGPKRRAGFHS